MTVDWEKLAEWLHHKAATSKRGLATAAGGAVKAVIECRERFTQEEADYGRDRRLG